MSFEFCWKWKSTHRRNFSNLHDEHNLCRHTITLCPGTHIRRKRLTWTAA